MVSSSIAFLNTLPAEILLLFLFIASSLFVLSFAYFFGKTGLYVYSVLAIILGNIQVLKGTHLALCAEPVALGTILFSSTFIVSDVLTDCFGVRAAQRSIGLGFMAALMLTVIMFLTLGVAPAEGEDGFFMQSHYAMGVLFTPSVAIFGASLAAYITSQLLDIYLFQRLKEAWSGRALWARSLLSTGLAFLVDNIIFSTLAWVVFSETPVSLHTLVWTYILGTYVLRLLASVCSLPVVYLTRRIIRASL